MTVTTCRLAVLISGAGSTMVNLAERIRGGEVPAEIALVVSSRASAAGVEKARTLGLETAVLSRKPFTRDGAFDEDAYARALADLLALARPDLVVLAGFMTRLGRAVLSRFQVINVHPALLPRFGGNGFYGHRVHEAVLAAGDKVTGATVHFSDLAYDTGPIILQEIVPVLAGDTPDTLATRVQAVERRIYPEAIRLFAEGRLVRDGDHVRILPEAGA
ncbi:MAG: phosphoribosylglycinamide formyltransferase [Deltaproteobacteria bacterium]|nr:phosphoribosylglycinamide formyltransferase [Deltaproteobacteria bacterium]